MFDPVSGYVLDFSSKGAVCEATNFHSDLEGLEHIKLTSRTQLQAYYRRYNLQPLIKESQLRDGLGSEMNNKATTDERCPKCNKRGLLFFTLQLRSADEGQTVFYECPACGSPNTDSTHIDLECS